jgi:hypothetical protein
MNDVRAVALIIVLVFLLIASGLAFSAMILFSSQHGITRSLMQLDEVRYAEEIGRRHAYWVWRYKYGDPEYFQSHPEECTQPCHIKIFDIEGDNVESVKVRVEDKNNNRKLDTGADEREIEIWINRQPWSLD